MLSRDYHNMENYCFEFLSHMHAINCRSLYLKQSYQEGVALPLCLAVDQPSEFWSCLEAIWLENSILRQDFFY